MLFYQMTVIILNNSDGDNDDASNDNVEMILVRIIMKIGYSKERQ